MLKKLVEELEKLQYNKCARGLHLSLQRLGVGANAGGLCRYWGDEEAKIRTRKINDKPRPMLHKSFFQGQLVHCLISRIIFQLAANYF